VMQVIETEVGPEFVQPNGGPSARLWPPFA